MLWFVFSLKVLLSQWIDNKLLPKIIKSCILSKRWLHLYFIFVFVTFLCLVSTSGTENYFTFPPLNISFCLPVYPFIAFVCHWVFCLTELRCLLLLREISFCLWGWVKPQNSLCTGNNLSHNLSTEVYFGGFRWPLFYRIYLIGYTI